MRLLYERNGYGGQIIPQPDAESHSRTGQTGTRRQSLPLRNAYAYSRCRASRGKGIGGGEYKTVDFLRTSGAVIVGFVDGPYAGELGIAQDGRSLPRQGDPLIRRKSIASSRFTRTGRFHLHQQSRRGSRVFASPSARWLPRNSEFQSKESPLSKATQDHARSRWNRRQHWDSVRRYGSPPGGGDGAAGYRQAAR